MFRWKSWRTSVPSERQASTSVCALVRPVIVAGMLLVLCLSAGLQVVLAESEIRVTLQRFDHAFSQSLDFGVQVSSASPIVQAVLFYGVEGEPIVRRIYPQFTPGIQLTLSHTELLERGQFAPGTRLRAWWAIEAADGSRLTTDEMALSYTHDEHDWTKMSQGRVDVLWYGSAQDRAQAERILDQAAQVVLRLEEQTGVAVEERIDIWVYNTQRDMGPALSQRSDVYDERILTLGVALDENTLLLLGSHRNVQLTVAHELSHIVVGIATDNPFVELPRWLDEGLAMTAEGELPDDNRLALEQAIRRDELLSVRSMTSYAGRPELVDLFYGQAHSVVQFLLDEHGPEAMDRLLGAFLDAQSQEEALLSAYGFGLDDLDVRWRQSLGLSSRRAGDEADETPSVGTSPASPPETSEGRAICPALGLALFMPVAAMVWGRRTVRPRM